MPAREWDALAGEDDPFVEHAFLAALEQSGSVGEEAGQVPRILLCRAGRELIGAVPLYRKTNSYGEFIFDWSWANAAHRVGVRYYPKLVAAVPFTPATGRRFLVRPDADVEAVTERLVAGMQHLATAEDDSSIHVLFCTEDEKRRLARLGLSPRLSLQFHWQNRPSRPYTDFDDFLSTLRAPARKQIRRERRLVAEQRLSIKTVTGREMDERDWAAVQRFYAANADKHGAFTYLSPSFFEIVRHAHADRVIATLAYRGDRAVAGTFNFEKGRHLYGRYWGAAEEVPMLHFELCYYRLIERAIARGCTRFEAGAQGEHKLKRGLDPAFTHSAHFIRSPVLRAAVDEYVRAEAEAMIERAAMYRAHSPYRTTDDPTRRASADDDGPGAET